MATDSLTCLVHDTLREHHALAAVVAVLSGNAMFSSLLGDQVDRESSSASGARLIVDGIRVALCYASQSEEPASPKPEWHDCEIVVQTNYEHYTVHARPTPRDTEFVLSWSEDAGTLEQLLKYHGGLLRLARCADWTILSRSIAIDLPAGNLLSDGRAAWPGESRLAAKLGVFVQRGARLRTILDVHKELFKYSAGPPPMRPESPFGTQHRILEPGLSPTLNYRCRVGVAVRGDYIVTYTSRDGIEHCREFLVDVDTSGNHAHDLRLLEYNLLYLLGIRRTKLFRSSYGSRLYSVILPSALLSRAGCPVLVVTPLVSLTRLPSRSQFRSTIGLTFIVVPVDVDDCDTLIARRPGLAEVTAISMDLTKSGTLRQFAGHYVMDGPLRGYIMDEEQSVSIPELIAKVADRLASRTCNGNAARCTLARHAAAKGVAESSMGSVCYLVGWPGGNRAPWVAWSSGAEDEIFERILYRSVFYDDHVNHANAFSTCESVDFRSLSLGNAHGADMSGLTFYNPQMDTKFVLYPMGAEQYPNHSMLRWFAWQIYLDVASSCVRALLGRFQDNIDTITDLRRALRAVQDLSTELSEVYDLDLSDFFYRREYERLRSILRLDSDYDYMRTRLASAQGTSSLREQILMNNLVLALTLSGILAATIVAIGQQYKWAPAEYIYGAVAAIGGSLMIGFGLFEPLRRVAVKIRLLIASRRR